MKLFIITGISGSGKTTIARHLHKLGYIALDSKLNPGLFHFVDESGHIPAHNNPNDPNWKTRHKWVLNQTKFHELTDRLTFDQPMFLCGGGDSLKALWPQAQNVFLLKIDASTLTRRLNDPNRDNQFAKNTVTHQALLNRLYKFQTKQINDGAIVIDATQPLDKVVQQILAHISSPNHNSTNPKPSDTAVNQPATIREGLTAATAFLTGRGIGSARLDTELLMAHALRRDRAWVLAHDDEPLTPYQQADFEAFVSRRSEHVPLVHLTGTREFYGLDLEVTPDVLTPRVETEQMVEWAVKYAPPGSRLVDIGTGSGAIAIAIAHHRPDLAVTATDLSAKELAVARRNAHRHAPGITFLESDLWSAFSAQPSSHFDVVVTNLPYLEDDADLMPEVRREPAVALFGGPDGLGLYRRFLAGLPAHLKPGGYLFTECDPWQHESLISEAAKYHLTPIEQGYFILGFRFDPS